VGVDLQEALARYEARLESCQEQVKGMTDLRQRIGILVGCQEHYEQLVLLAKMAISLEALASAFVPSQDEVDFDSIDVDWEQEESELRTA